eukprot:TRINITY_DN1566_c0_g1_i1.p1 TRINITY_DN1566_c0_g1~~TRINITY_DN1566_c0_g1_i1.p1  ORF type:complete len:201 (-),score=39.46 TRINITY_DN1566_c0_g1_i1:111-668(-)
MDVIRTHLEGFPLLDDAEKKSGVKKEFIVIGLAVLLVALIFLGFFAAQIIFVIGFLWPAYASFKAIETPEEGDDKQWLTYWIVFAAFSFVESFGDYVLWVLPFYNLAKITFLFWAFHPKWKGSLYIYDNYLGPFLRKYEAHVDTALSQVGKVASKVSDNVANEVKNAKGKIVDAAVEGLRKRDKN